MPLPRKTPNSTLYARMAARGCFTRLALFFNSRPNEKFTGDEIARILIAAVEAIGSPETGIKSFAEIESKSFTELCAVELPPKEIIGG